MMKASEDRVFELIAAYGAEPGAWPEDEREAAKATLAAFPERFADALAEAKALDLALFNETLPEPDPDLANRILAAAPSAPRQARGIGSLLKWRLPGRQWPAGATLASLMIGLVSGYAYAGNATSADFETADEFYVGFFEQADATSIDWLDEGIIE